MHGNTKHGHYVGPGNRPSATLISWSGMINRCLDPEKGNYHLYGGRGVKVDPRWLDFSNFLSDMGERPKGYTLDRIDTNGDYCKENCHWACPARQQHTRRDAKLSWEKIDRIKWMRIEGFSQTEIAAEFGVTQGAISRVLNGRRWKSELPVVKLGDVTQRTA